MLTRDQWHDLARKLDWDFSYVAEAEVFPADVSGRPALPQTAWASWDEPYRTAYGEYVATQHLKETAIGLADAAAADPTAAALDRGWQSAVKLHAATLPLAEFAAVVGNLRAARFGRDSAWRSTALFGALDELRHTQLPLRLMHGRVADDPQYDWTHRFLHTDQWVAIAGRHLVDGLLLAADPIELAVGVNFVFETGFTNLQFVGLSAVADAVGDRRFAQLLQSIQTDEARHSQIGGPVLRTLIAHDPAYAQELVDTWFWRSWLFFAVVTGFAMDYLTPLAHRRGSFKEFVEEWVVDQFQRQLLDLGLRRPWYWELFVDGLDTYHHMVYASAYTHRATVWFDLAAPGPDERAWLAARYPRTWHLFDPVWARVGERWRTSGPDVEWYTHGATPVGFCDMCQLVLCGGSPLHNTAITHDHAGRRYVFCSEPCLWIFERTPARYAAHAGVVGRILAGDAPGNLIALCRDSFGLDEATWGRDVTGGRYPWLAAPGRAEER